MTQYTIKWNAVKDGNYNHTAVTMYEADGFRIWKGRRLIIGCIYSTNEWHLIRTSDGKELHYAKTAKECMGVLEHAIKYGYDIYHDDHIGGYYGMKFDENFNVVW